MLGAGEARHKRPALPAEAQQEGPAHRRDDALHALAALLLQPRTLQLLRPERESTCPSSSNDDAQPHMRDSAATPPPARSHAEPKATVGDLRVMADKSTQCSPERDSRASSSHGTDQRPHEPAVSEHAPEEQLPQRALVEKGTQQRPVMVDREVQSAPEASEAAQLESLRESLVEHIAEAVAARLLDSRSLSQPAAEKASPADSFTDEATEAEAIGAADASCTIQIVMDHRGQISGADVAGSELPETAAKDSAEACPSLAEEEANLEAEKAPSDAAEPSGEEGPTQGTGKAKGTQTQQTSGQEEVTETAGPWIEQWRGRLTQQEMEQAAQDVIAEELARLLDSWDGAHGSLPSALHGLAQRRNSPTPTGDHENPLAREAAGAAAHPFLGSSERTSAGPGRVAPVPQDRRAEETSAEQHHAACQQIAGGSSAEDFECHLAAEEAARGVQARMQELLQRQQEAEIDPLLHAVLDSLAEASLERLLARSPQQGASPQRAPIAVQARHTQAADRHFIPGRGTAHRQGSPSRRAAERDASKAVPSWGGGFWRPDQAQQGHAGGRPERAGRADRAKSLERLKRRRQTALRRDTALQRDAAVQTSDLPDGTNAQPQESEILEHASERVFYGARRAHAENEGALRGPYGMVDASDGLSGSAAADQSRPASPDLQEQQRSRAWSEDEDEAQTRDQPLRLLQRPRPPDNSRPHGSLPGAAAGISQ